MQIQHVTQHSPTLEIELKNAWITAAGTGVHAGTPMGDAMARAEVFYDVARLLYDEMKFHRPTGLPGELISVGKVTDSALAHVTRVSTAIRNSASVI